VKFIEPESLADERFVLGIEPLHPPAGIDFRRLKVEVLDVLAHLTAEATGLVMKRAPDDENSPPERPMGFDPQETFNVKDGVGIQTVKLNPVGEEKPAGERKTLGGEKQRKVPESPRVAGE
jgi:hypothetical protein